MSEIYISVFDNFYKLSENNLEIILIKNDDYWKYNDIQKNSMQITRK